MKTLLWRVFFLFFAGPAGAGDLTAESFWLCLQKRATGPVVRTLRLHYFPEEDLYVTIYTLKGQDQIKCRGRRKRVCRKVLEEIKANLEKGLWECSAEPAVNVFYPQKASAGAKTPEISSPLTSTDKNQKSEETLSEKPAKTDPVPPAQLSANPSQDNP